MQAVRLGLCKLLAPRLEHCAAVRTFQHRELAVLERCAASYGILLGCLCADLKTCAQVSGSSPSLSARPSLLPSLLLCLLW